VRPRSEAGHEAHGSRRGQANGGFCAPTTLFRGLYSSPQPAERPCGWCDPNLPAQSRLRS
jgi:hypothetical protein